MKIYSNKLINTFFTNFNIGNYRKEKEMKKLGALFIVLLVLLSACSSNTKGEKVATPNNEDIYTINPGCIVSLGGSMHDETVKGNFYKYLELEQKKDKAEMNFMLGESKIEELSGGSKPMEVFFVDEEDKMVGLFTNFKDISGTTRLVVAYTTFACISPAKSDDESKK
jgi:major membrane immunogen (membrane-anchored lipoprotein)